jgi:hypothetical protein
MPMPDDLLPPAVVNDPPEPRPTRRDRIRCEFCGCTLTSTGEILSLSDDARGHRDRKEEMAKQKALIDKLEKDLAEANARLKPAEPATRGLILK